MNRPLVYAALAVTVLSPHLLEYSHVVMTEIPYMALSMLALWALLRSEREPRRYDDLNRIMWRFLRRMGEQVDFSWLHFTLLAVAAYYTRTIGGTLVCAGILWLFLHGRSREALKSAVLSFALIAAWEIRTMRLVGWDPAAKPYLSQLTQLDPYHPEQGLAGIWDIGWRFIENVQAYVFRDVPVAVCPLFAWFDWELICPPVSWVAWMVIDGLLAVYIIRGLWKGALIPIYLMLYFGVLCLWPTVWTCHRFVIPVIPLLFYGMLRAAWDIAGAIERRARREPGP